MCRAYADPKGTAVDCTCGRGKDTLWLARHCGRVYSFDIQEEALKSTEELLDANEIDCRERSGSQKVILIKDSHKNIKKYVKDRPCLILFNLGYLPGGDKQITTVAETTIRALKDALDLLAQDGLISIIMYPGHCAGALEKEAVLKWSRTLDPGIYHCVYADMINQKKDAPQILWITKKA